MAGGPKLRQFLPVSGRCSAAVAMVALRAGSTVTDVSSNSVDDGEDWDSDYQREIIEDVSVSDDDDSCGSAESVWEDPVDVARRERVDDYGFDSSDSSRLFMKLPDAMRKEALGAAVPLPADDVGRVALSPVEVRLSVSDMCIDNINAEGLQCWTTDRYILDQYETFNRLPVYYGGDLYDSEDSEWDDPYALASAAHVEDYNFDVPDGMDLMRPGAHRLSRSEITVDVETKPHIDNDPDDPDQVDIGCDVRSLTDAVPAMLDMTAAVPLAMPVVVQTRPQVSCDPALPLPMYKGQESLMEDGPDDIISGRESAVMISDVGRDICVEPDQLPVVVSEEAVGPLAFTAVDLTRSQGGGALVVARPADAETISQV